MQNTSHVLIHFIFFFLCKDLFLLCVCVHLCMFMCTWVHRLWRSQVSNPVTGVTGGGDPPTMGAGNYTRVFWKNNKCSSLPSCQPQITGIWLWLAHLTLNGADIVPFIISTDKVICLRSGNFQPNLTCFSISVSFFLVLGIESKTLNILRKYWAASQWRYFF